MKDSEVFGLNMQIEGGELAGAFGAEAYLRIIPQANNTFRGEFTRDFSGEKPLTNLIAVDRHPPRPLVRPGLADRRGLSAVAACWLVDRADRSRGRSDDARLRPGGPSADGRALDAG